MGVHFYRWVDRDGLGVGYGSRSSSLLDRILLWEFLGKSLVLGLSKQKDLVHVPFGGVANERTHSLGYRMSQAIKKTRPENHQYQDKENGAHEGSQPRGQPGSQPQPLDPRARACGEFRCPFSKFPCRMPDDPRLVYVEAALFLEEEAGAPPLSHKEVQSSAVLENDTRQRVYLVLEANDGSGYFV